MKFDKHQQVFLRRKLDLRKTGGPLLPKGSPMTIQVRRRTGELWVRFLNIDYHTQVMPEDVSGFTQ